MSFLVHNILHFSRILNHLGLISQAGRTQEVIVALNYIDIRNPLEFYHTLRTLLVYRVDDLALFDEAFRLFFIRTKSQQLQTHRRKTKDSKPPDSKSSKSKSSQTQQNSDTVNRPPRHDMARTTVLSYSDQETLSTKDFAQFSTAEVSAARRLIQELKWELAKRQSKRWTPRRGNALDLRKIIRTNMRYGGEIIELSRRRRRTKRRPLVLLCDVSGSMEHYSRMLLHFIHTLTGGGKQGRVEAFVFATRLTRITRQLMTKTADSALARLPRSIGDFGGGTRIGDALRTFNVEWARRIRSQSPIVLLISDGWDRGEPDHLRQEMARLHRTCHRLIWLNPLLGSPDYLPLTQGMRAALPLIDDFLPVHNLQSLQALALHLNELPRHSRHRYFSSIGT